ncbi:acetyltransferase [Clostridiales bacterium FE2011]|nr:acetyltransferase [Clostridiales bacterium FE2011]
MNKLMIVGASGHGRVVADIARQTGYTDIVFLDDDMTRKECGRYPVIGKPKDYSPDEGDLFVAIGNTTIRKRIMNQLGMCITLIHPKAIIAEDVQIGEGSVIMAGAVVNPGTRIGRGCIVNTCSSIDHDCVIGNYSHISVGAHLAGNVVIGEETWIGIGSIVSNNINICSDSMIGAGAVVIRNIDESGTYVGVPARRRK